MLLLGKPELKGLKNVFSKVFILNLIKDNEVPIQRKSLSAASEVTSVGAK
jgi:hypothetical protein